MDKEVDLRDRMVVGSAATMAAAEAGPADQMALGPEEAEEALPAEEAPGQAPLLAAGALEEPSQTPLVAAGAQEEASDRRPRFHGEQPQPHLL